jgi:hypothetical protein
MWLGSESDKELGVAGSSSVKTKKMPGGDPKQFPEEFPQAAEVVWEKAVKTS